jgi:hypothetical protein
MQLPKLSAGVERTVSAAPVRGQVQSSQANCTGLCAPGGLCSNGCVCQCFGADCMCVNPLFPGRH